MAGLVAQVGFIRLKPLILCMLLPSNGMVLSRASSASYSTPLSRKFLRAGGVARKASNRRAGSACAWLSMTAE